MMDSSATNQKISWFKKEDSAGLLDLTPQFQRRPVWTEEQSSYLIDTILEKLPIPEVYIRSSSTPEGETSYEVVDGQQRMRSILQFSSNDLILSGNQVGAKWFGRSFEDLADNEKTSFWDYKIVVRDVSGASDIEIRDLFKRLNIHSVVLNDQELRHAQLSGQFIQTMESLADDEWWLDSRIVNIRQIRRMEDVEFISELFVGMMAGPQDKKKSLDTYYINYDAAIPEKGMWVRRFEATRDLIKSLFSDQEMRKWSGKSDFYSLFLALSPITLEKLSASRKKALSADLMGFRQRVDQAKRKDNQRSFAKDVHEYAEAVARAATDLGRREARLRILERRIQTTLAKG